MVELKGEGVMIHVLIVDDQDILRDGLSLLLNQEKDIEIIGTAANGEEAVSKCKVLNPDVVLMDIRMPIMNGVGATKIIKESMNNVKVLILTTFNDDEYIFDSLKNGASGYILKDSSPPIIAKAIREVFQGGTYMQPNVASKVVEQFLELSRNNNVKKDDIEEAALTNREKDICNLLAEGKNNKEIADSLYISEGTVKNHITNILEKLNLRDRTQLAIYAVKKGMGVR